jgi:hypothetical protein
MQCRGCSRTAKCRVKGGKVKADKGHDLCRQCWRSEMDRRRPVSPRKEARQSVRNRRIPLW